jgi:hypothetical protein
MPTKACSAICVPALTPASVAPNNVAQQSPDLPHLKLQFYVYLVLRIIQNIFSAYLARSSGSITVTKPDRVAGCGLPD